MVKLKLILHHGGHVRSSMDLCLSVHRWVWWVHVNIQFRSNSDHSLVYDPNYPEMLIFQLFLTKHTSYIPWIFSNCCCFHQTTWLVLTSIDIKKEIPDEISPDLLTCKAAILFFHYGKNFFFVYLIIIIIINLYSALCEKLQSALQNRYIKYIAYIKYTVNTL